MRRLFFFLLLLVLPLVYAYVILFLFFFHISCLVVGNFLFFCLHFIINIEKNTTSSHTRATFLYNFFPLFLRIFCVFMQNTFLQLSHKTEASQTYLRYINIEDI